MGKSIYKTWQERIASGVLTKSQCQQFGKAVAMQAAGYEPGGMKTNLTAGESKILMSIMKDRGGVRLTEEHTAQGLAWIASRAGKELFGEDVQSKILADFSHFRFMGDIEISGTSYWPQATVVWRIHLNDGTMIDYYTGSWQSGRTGTWRYVRESDVLLAKELAKDALLDRAAFATETGLDREDVLFEDAFRSFHTSGETFSSWWANKQGQYV